MSGESARRRQCLSQGSQGGNQSGQENGQEQRRPDRLAEAARKREAAEVAARKAEAG
jgi:hypothetical protein